jgi:hypothetical protein
MVSPLTKACYNNLGAVDWWYIHGMICDEVHKELVQSCHFAVDQQIVRDLNTPCQRDMEVVYNDWKVLDDKNIYAPISHDLCSDDLICTYLIRPEVREALHVQRNGSWRAYSDVVSTN